MWRNCPISGRRKKRRILSRLWLSWFFRRTQEGCGGLGGENPAAFPQTRLIFQQPFSLPESAQTLAGLAFRAAGKSSFSSSVEICRKTFPAGNFGQLQPSWVFGVFSVPNKRGRWSGEKCHWEIKGRFRKRVVLAHVPSFRFFVPGEHVNVPSVRLSFRENIQMYPRSGGFRSGEIRQTHPFGKHPFVNPRT